MVAFIFNPEKGETPEGLARQRAIAAQLMASGRAPRNVGEGLVALGDGLVAGVLNSRASAGEQAGAESWNKDWSGIAAALGGGAFPPAPNPADTASMATMPAPDMASARVAQAHGDSGGGFNGDLRSGIIETARAIGADPMDLATAISYETAGTFDPTKRGPRTQWGQHRGLIQFGEPQARQHGVDWSNPVRSQLGPDGAIASYFRSSGFKPGMSGLDLYSTINAGAPGRYAASDANNGGAPGSVRDKWETQMAGHRQKAMALLGNIDAAPASAPATASSLTSEALQAWAATNYAPEQQGGALDAVNALGASQPVGVAENEADVLAQEAAMAGQDPQAFAAPGAMPAQPDPNAGIAAALMQQPQQEAPAPASIQGVASALGAGGMPEMAGVQQRPVPGPSLDQLLRVASNPHMPAHMRPIVSALLQQEMQSRDPMRQLEMQKLQRELAAPPERKTATIDGRLVDTQTGQIISDFGQRPTTGIQEYEYYADQMRRAGIEPQPFDVWDQGRRKSGAPNVNVGGNSSKFIEESDKAAAGRMNDYVVQGSQAGQMMSDMQQLLDLGSQIGTGKEAELKAAFGPYAQMLGIEIDRLGEAQAFKSITDRLAPQMRPVGAGSSSDRDVAMYLNSLPNLRNSPEGNAIIANTMRGLAQNKMEAAEIAARAQAGEITWQAAEKQIRALPNPYENFKEFMTQSGKGNRTSSGIQWSIEP